MVASVNIFRFFLDGDFFGDACVLNLDVEDSGATRRITAEREKLHTTRACGQPHFTAFGGNRFRFQNEAIIIFTII